MLKLCNFIAISLHPGLVICTADYCAKYPLVVSIKHTLPQQLAMKNRTNEKGIQRRIFHPTEA